MKSTIMLLPIALSCFLCSCSKPSEEPIQINGMGGEASMNPKGKFVYWCKNVPKNTLVSNDVVEEKEVVRNKIPEHMVEGAPYAMGTRLRFEAIEGQLVDERDLLKDNDIDVVLDDKSRQALNELAEKAGQKPSVLVTQWITEKLDTSSK